MTLNSLFSFCRINAEDNPATSITELANKKVLVLDETGIIIRLEGSIHRTSTLSGAVRHSEDTKSFKHRHYMVQINTCHFMYTFRAVSYFRFRKLKLCKLITVLMDTILHFFSICSVTGINVVYKVVIFLLNVALLADSFTLPGHIVVL